MIQQERIGKDLILKEFKLRLTHFNTEFKLKLDEILKKNFTDAQFCCKLYVIRRLPRQRHKHCHTRILIALPDLEIYRNSITPHMDSETENDPAITPQNTLDSKSTLSHPPAPVPQSLASEQEVTFNTPTSTNFATRSTVSFTDLEALIIPF